MNLATKKQFLFAAPDYSIVREVNRRILLAVTLVAVLVITSNYFYSRSAAHNQLQARADALITTMSETLTTPLWTLDLENIEKISRAFANNDWLAYVRVVDAHDEPLITVGSEDRRMVFREAELRFEDQPIGRMRIGLTLLPLDQEIRGLLWSSLSVIAVVLVTLFIFIRYFLRSSLQQPLAVLLWRIDQIAGGHYAQVPTPIRHGEIKTIVERFDAMAAKVEQREQSLKQAEAMLKTHRDQLEQSVDERTCELQQEILDHQQTEQQLRDSREKAESANRAKSEFLANMSHELRTPLNGILGYAQILQKQVAPAEPARQQGLAVIRQCGEHLLTLINDILDLAKVEAGKLEPQARDFSLPKLVAELDALFRARAEGKGLSFQVRTPDELPAALRGDDRKLRQVLINLLGNAVKFTATGAVSLRVSRVGDAFHFEIEDSGVGIADEHLKEIFEPFGQVGDAAAHEGTGLGLPISKRLVGIIGGRLRVASTPGRGSRFWFDLDLLPTEKGAENGLIERVERTVVGFEGSPQRVLIADDNPVNRAVLAGLLEPLGFICTEAIDGQDCLDKAGDFQPHLILLDLVMPRVDGLQATHSLRRQASLAGVVIIALSASAFTIHREQCLQAGCDEFLPKPIETESLLQTIAQLLGLVWRYETPSDDRINAENPVTNSTPVDFNDLPEANAAALCKAARAGYAAEVLRQVAELEALGESYRGPVEQLRVLIKQFKFKQIINLLQPDARG